MKNHKKDRSDASLQVDHLAMFMVPDWSPSSHQGGYLENIYIPPGLALWLVTKTHIRCVLLKKFSPGTYSDLR